MRQKIGLLEIKQALKDPRFINSLPKDMSEDVRKYLAQPGCGPCNIDFYRKILKFCTTQLREYFPNREIGTNEEEDKKLKENNWSVINCNIKELESELRKLPPGRKQIAMSRYQDQVTVIVNEVDVLY